MNPSDVKQRYQDEDVARSYDRVRFSGPVGRIIDALEKRAFKKALACVRRDLSSPKVLDIPCGTGRITEVLLDAGLEVTGGDISFPMMEIAQNKLARYGDRASFRHLDLEAIDLPDDSCDVVTYTASWPTVCRRDVKVCSPGSSRRAACFRTHRGPATPANRIAELCTPAVCALDARTSRWYSETCPTPRPPGHRWTKRIEYPVRQGEAVCPSDG